MWSLCWEGVLTASSLLFTHTLYMWTGEESLSGVEGGAHRNRVSEACGREEAAAAGMRWGRAGLGVSDGRCPFGAGVGLAGSGWPGWGNQGQAGGCQDSRAEGPGKGLHASPLVWSQRAEDGGAWPGAGPGTLEVGAGGGVYRWGRRERAGPCRGRGGSGRSEMPAPCTRQVGACPRSAPGAGS